MRRSAVVALAAVLASVVLPGPAAADDVFPRVSYERPRFVANLVALPAVTDSAHVDVLWEIPYDELSFRLEDDWYRAIYDVSVVFLRDGRQVAGEVWERRVRTRRLSETTSSEDLAKGRRRVTIPTGRYDVRITLTDRRTRKSSRVEGNLDAFSKGLRIGLSYPRFVRYTKGNAVPNPGNEIPIGEAGHRVRFSVHPDESIRGASAVSWRIENADRERVVSGDTTLTLAGVPETIEIPIPSERLSAGAHRLVLRVTGPEGKGGESRTASLFARLTPRWFLLHRKPALEVLRIVATDEEVRRLENASDREWPRRVEEFWERRDPIPSTSINEFRETIQERMETAATLFREPFLRPGWRTDRGHIWMKFGEPAVRSVLRLA